MNGSQLKHSETSTLYINTGRGPTVQPSSYVTQIPQVQKRVVTHVTIFPSPPPDSAAAATEATKLEKVTAKITTGAVPTRISRENSAEEDSSSKRDSSKAGQDSTGSSGGATKAATSSSGEEGGAALLLAKHWGPERLVELQKEPNKSLGISIVGGKVIS
jgi:hypothetical protein